MPSQLKKSKKPASAIDIFENPLAEGKSRSKYGKNSNKVAPFAFQWEPERNMSGYSYPEEIKVLAISLFSQGHSYRAIARKTGVRSSSTIHAWVNGSDVEDFATADVVERIKRNLSARNYSLASNIMGAISKKDVKNATLQQKVTSAAILQEKGRLMEGKSTHNVASMSKYVVKRDTELSTIEKEIAALEAEVGSEGAL